MKGVILAGGLGTRLSPLTDVICKQLLPVFDKPMIYYPLSTLILSGVDEVLIICNKKDLDSFKNLLNNGEEFGISIQYKVQDSPEGLAHGLLLAEDFIGKSNFWFILGDNLFYGPSFGINLKDSENPKDGSKIFTYQVNNPEDYGVANFDSQGNLTRIEEKPVDKKSNWAILGMYYFDQTAFKRALNLKPSQRGELEIIDLLDSYLSDGILYYEKISIDNYWFDLGSAESLLDGANFIRINQDNKRILIGSPEYSSFIFRGFIYKKFNKLNTSKVSPYYRKLMGLYEEKIHYKQS